MDQLILHLFGDYILQSDWMATNKTSQSVAAGVHAIVYSLPFLLLRPSWMAFSVILVTHFFIDRFRVAKYVVWFKNLLVPRIKSVSHEQMGNYDVLRTIWEVDPRLYWDNCKITGYPSETPIWLAMWLLIIADNTLHLAINYLSLKYL